MAASAAFSQTTLANWDLICFCNSRVSTPHRIIRMEQNGAILYAARSGTTREELIRSGITASESAIELLHDWGLLAVRGDTLRTAFPVLGPDRMGALRRQLRAAATEMAPTIRALIDTITASLAADAMAESAYALVFSYVLDGLVWEEFGKDADVAAQIDIEHPFWNGAFWAVSPKRNNVPGTNSYRLDDSTTVLITWTESTLDVLAPLQAKNQLHALADAVRSHDATKLPAALREYDLFKRDGSPAFATIHLRLNSALATRSRSLARQVANGMRAWLGSADRLNQLQTQDPKLALLISYHEFMWELLDALETSAAVRKPPILRASPQRNLVAPLILMIQK